MSQTPEYTIDRAVNDVVGVDSYPEYHALWHLEKIGVIDDLTTGDSAAWDDATRAPVTVALIDTPVAWQNPNLYDAIDRARMIDFSVEDNGAFPVPSGDLGTSDAQAARAAVQNTPDGQLRSDASVSSAVNPAFAGHGTAMAGLIGARPLDSAVPLMHKPSNMDGTGYGEEPVVLPYAGVNPCCQIVPISTSQSPNAKMLLNAFAYAQEIGADVIVFATALVPEFQGDGHGCESGADDCAGQLPTPETTGPLTADWQALEDKILEIGAQTYIVCAAGNAGVDAAVYPASLSTAANKIISVGALASDETLAAYSTAQADVYVPSGDAPHLDLDGFRVDPFASNRVGLPGKPDDVPRSTAAYAELITTDVPGPFGYNPSVYDWAPPAQGPHLEIASLFCELTDVPTFLKITDL